MQQYGGLQQMERHRDDEDETHPNIDTPSLFRWRHQARVERMEEQRKEREKYEKIKLENERKRRETSKKLEESEKSGVGDTEALRKALKDLEAEGDALRKKEEELRRQERITPWNVDTISHSGFSKTVINRAPSRKKTDEETEEDRVNKMQEFIKKNKKELRNYGMLHKYDDSKVYLQEHPHIVSEHTANYLVIWCIDLQVEEVSEVSKMLVKVIHDQVYVMIQIADPEYKKSFEDELAGFKERIRKRAREKIEEAMKEAEEEERKKRLGPGGLDPVEVFESLPLEMQKCFETENIQMLQEVIAKMPEKEACYHMKRCIDSGMWIPDGKKKDEDSPSKGEAGASEAAGSSEGDIAKDDGESAAR
ncbi:hypothetical protein J437_LFUL010369 [Ladona fulva]|uniref:Hsp90 chaperone protein kinase-targeting subunit n=1 Tax=Ladona fulva TaxID=123851 RepID=A0A8K0KDC3_LADFU|nr:hypothetical protein J437_LFUL010369 [Ladona fulva]